MRFILYLVSCGGISISAELISTFQASERLFVRSLDAGAINILVRAIVRALSNLDLADVTKYKSQFLLVSGAMASGEGNRDNTQFSNRLTQCDLSDGVAAD